jgi:hypothetical protein
MHRISAIRFRQMMRIEARRADINERIESLLANQKSGRLSEESIIEIDPLSRENKRLYTQTQTLWRSILSLDGEELTNKEIEGKVHEAWLGFHVLGRIMKRIDSNADGGGESLCVLSRLRMDLWRVRDDLETAHDRHRLAQAELLVRRRTKRA